MDHTSYFNWKFFLKNGRTLGSEIDTSFFNWEIFLKNGRTLGLEIDTSFFNWKFFLKKGRTLGFLRLINLGESYLVPHHRRLGE